MSKATFELGELICQHLTLRYAPHRRQALAQAAKEMGATVEEIMAVSLAQQITRRFDLTPKGEPCRRGRFFRRTAVPAVTQPAWGA